ncbi:nuclear pore complex assembly-domain-containing protein [Lipomyces japonicus]|uniref:nuclear pore complex assembly-domain-containing protein n=1 Tax=Lipomyces japonicus TaxID=56871 RepID=UPI0034CDC06A
MVEADESYDDIFPQSLFPFSRDRVSFITSQRNKLDGYLFLDLLATDIAGISDVQDFYPPADQQSLKDLYFRISNSNSDILKKHCLLYYILQDYNADRANDYAKNVLLPDSHKRLIDGIISLDRFEFKTAMTNLTHPGVRLQYTEKVLSTLLNHAENGALYVRMYVTATSPVLDTEHAARLYLQALCQISIASSILFLRTVSPYWRAGLFKILVEYYVGTGSGEHAYELANLALSEDEDELIRQELQQHAGLVAHNVLLVRGLHKRPESNVKPGTSEKSTRWAVFARQLKENPSQAIQL